MPEIPERGEQQIQQLPIEQMYDLLGTRPPPEEHSIASQRTHRGEDEDVIGMTAPASRASQQDIVMERARYMALQQDV